MILCSPAGLDPMILKRRNAAATKCSGVPPHERYLEAFPWMLQTTILPGPLAAQSAPGWSRTEWWLRSRSANGFLFRRRETAG